MLLLLAIGLVLVGVVTLVIGIISNTLAWVFVSIGSTVAAGVVLYILYRLGRKQAAAGTAATTAEPVPASQPATQPIPTVPAPTTVPPAAQPADEARFARGAAASTEPAVSAEPAASSVATLTRDEGAADGYDEDFDDDDGDLFPIAEYDDLRVAEILPLLPELDDDELEIVRAREVSTKNRGTILNRIDELAPAAAGTSAAQPATVAATPAEPAVRSTGASSGPSAASSAAMPIRGYDDLKVAEILPRLTQLDGSELHAVARYERDTQNRQTILNRVEARIKTVEGRTGRVDGSSAPSGARRGRPPATPTPTAVPAAASSAGRRGTGATKAASARAATAKVGRSAAAAGRSAAGAKTTGRSAAAAKSTGRSAAAAKSTGRTARSATATPAKGSPARIGRPPGSKTATAKAAPAKARGTTKATAKTTKATAKATKAASKTARAAKR